MCPTVENLGTVPVGCACVPHSREPQPLVMPWSQQKSSSIHATMLTNVLIRMHVAAPDDDDDDDGDDDGCCYFFGHNDT